MKNLSKSEFIQNIRLVLAVCDFLDIKREISYSGIMKAVPDKGSLKFWKAEFEALSSGRLSSLCLSAGGTLSVLFQLMTQSQHAMSLIS